MKEKKVDTKGKKQSQKKNDGKFPKGNTIGKETRAKVGDKLANKYKEEYCENILKYFHEPEVTVLYKESFYSDGSLKSREPVILAPKYPTFELYAASLMQTHKQQKQKML